LILILLHDKAIVTYTLILILLHEKAIVTYLHWFLFYSWWSNRDVYINSYFTSS